MINVSAAQSCPIIDSMIQQPAQVSFYTERVTQHHKYGRIQHRRKSQKTSIMSRLMVHKGSIFKLCPHKFRTEEAFCRGGEMSSRTPKQVQHLTLDNYNWNEMNENLHRHQEIYTFPLRMTLKKIAETGKQCGVILSLTITCNKWWIARR